MLREVLARLVVPAHRVHPSSRLPLTVQHLLGFLPPSYLLDLLLLHWALYIEYSASWDSSFLAPRSPTDFWLQFTPLVPPTHLIPVSCLLVLLSPGCTAVGATSAPWEPLMAPCSSSCLLGLCVHVCTYSSSCFLGLCVHAHYSPPLFLSSSVASS